MLAVCRCEWRGRRACCPTAKVASSQPRPESEKSPYFELERKYKVQLAFCPFIKLDGIPAKDFRRQKIDIASYSGIIFTSRNAIDHFFRLCEEMKIAVSQETKYFCITEQTANYLQKYIVIRKRKVFTGTKTALDLLEIIKKHKTEKFLFPCSNKRQKDLPDYMGTNDFKITEAVMYETVSSDLSDLENVFYDVLAFYSPSGITSLLENFPEFKQNNTNRGFWPYDCSGGKRCQFDFGYSGSHAECPLHDGCARAIHQTSK